MLHNNVRVHAAGHLPAAALCRQKIRVQGFFPRLYVTMSLCLTLLTISAGCTSTQHKDRPACTTVARRQVACKLAD